MAKIQTAQKALGAAVGERLSEAAEEKTRDWWDRYLKGALPFRGVPMAKIRSVIHDVWRAQDLGKLPPDEQISLALGLLAERHSEDKIAGVLALAELLLDDLSIAHVEALASPFAAGHIQDWSTCDWYCVKVLGPFVARGADRKKRAEAIAAWRFAEGLWQRRAAAVAFANFARKGDSFFPGFTELLLTVCDANAADLARFSQTSVGWILRELSHAEPAAVAQFVEQNKDRLSKEAVRMATAKLQPGSKRRR